MNSKPLPVVWASVISALLFFLIFLLLAVAAPKNLGGGDVKLSFIIGLVTGFYAGLEGAALAFLLIFLLGGITATVLLLAKSKNILPFAPAMFLGSAIIICFW